MMIAIKIEHARIGFYYFNDDREKENDDEY